MSLMNDPTGTGAPAPEGRPREDTASSPPTAPTLPDSADSAFSSGQTLAYVGPAPASTAGGEGEAAAPAAPADLPAVAGYEVLGVLGRGATGVVYQARQVGLNRVVALKMILAGAHAAAGQLARFRAEAEAAARLQHPNIVQVYEVGERDGLPYFSLEYVDGGSLDRRIAGAPQPPRQSAALVQVLTRAMAYAHERGVVHRDLKPANVLLTAGGVPKVADFGLAKRLEGDATATRSGVVVGTASYMAPEQAAGQAHEVGPAADVYALGAILYELLTGRPPFRGGSLFETLRLVRTREPVPPRQLAAGVPRDLETVCLKCLQKEPAKRYASADALADDLGRFLAGEPIRARRVSAPERLWRWARREPRLALLAGAVAVLLLTVALGSLAFAWRLKREMDATERARQEADASALAEKEARRKADESTKAEKEARQKADESTKAARRNLEQAVNQHGLALDRVVQMAERLHGRLQQGGSGPEVRALREAVLKDALDTLAEAAHEAERGGLTSFSRVAAHFKMGRLFRTLGRPAEAVRQYEQARDLLVRLAPQRPSDDKVRGNLALILTSLGEAIVDARGDVPAARALYRQALEVQQDLIAHPRNNAYSEADNWRLLANYRAALGQADLLLGDPAAARQQLLEALALRERLAARQSQYRSHLADTYDALGDVSWRLRDAAATDDCYRKALAIREALAARSPTDAADRAALAHTGSAYGDAHLRLGRAKEALALYRKALPIRQAGAESSPHNVRAQAALAYTHYRIATALLRLGPQEEAEGEYRQALALYERPPLAGSASLHDRGNTAVALARCGRAAEAVGRVEALCKDAPRSAGARLDAACCYAVCAARTADTARQAEYRRKAVAALREAAGPGYKDVAALETDPDLDALRGAPEFKALLAELKKR
jgi:eukaryotic-like serine/threonine-protein kinase